MGVAGLGRRATVCNSSSDRVAGPAPHHPSRRTLHVARKAGSARTHRDVEVASPGSGVSRTGGPDPRVVRGSHSGVPHPRLTPVTLPGTVPTHAGCCDKMPSTRRLTYKRRKRTAHSSVGWDGQDQGATGSASGAGPPPGARTAVPFRTPVAGGSSPGLFHQGTSRIHEGSALMPCSPPKGPSSQCHRGAVRPQGMDLAGGRECADRAGRPRDEGPETGTRGAGVGRWGAGKSHTPRPRRGPEGGGKRSPPQTAWTEGLVAHVAWGEARRLEDVSGRRGPLAVFLLAL